MRRRDLAFLCLLWGGILATLAWALSTQSRWVQESRPVQVQRPVKPEASEPAPDATGASGVIGTVSDDTVTSMSKGLDSPPAPKAESKPGQKTKGTPRK